MNGSISRLLVERMVHVYENHGTFYPTPKPFRNKEKVKRGKKNKTGERNDPNRKR